LRSRISFWAAAASFHSAGSSARLFSSARRASAASQSKMPPQQGNGLLDVVNGARDFRAHGGDIRTRIAKVKPVTAAARLSSPRSPLSQIHQDLLWRFARRGSQ
jgi:hypothetical protein